MIDGFFRIAFTGTAGSGFGMLTFRSGIIAGADVAGMLYDGTYAENPSTGDLDIKVNMRAPAGVTPVQTGVALTADATFPISAKLPRVAMDNEAPILLQTPLGPVNLVLRKIREFP
ncbi:MAG: hypothetical protein ACP5QR_15570 [Rhizomicrobium sp.]